MRIALPLLIVAVACSSATVDAAVIAGWDFNDYSSWGASPSAPDTLDSNLTVGGLTRGPGVTLSGTAAARAWGGNGWNGNATAAAAIAAGDYATFTVQADPNYTVSFSSIDPFQYRRSSTGPADGLLQYDVGSGFTDIQAFSYSVTASTGGSIAAIDLTGITALQNVPATTNVSFRIVNWNASGSTGTWYLFDVGTDPGVNDFVVNGTVSPVPEPTAVLMGSLAAVGFAVFRRRSKSRLM